MPQLFDINWIKRQSRSVGTINGNASELILIKHKNYRLRRIPVISSLLCNRVISVPRFVAVAGGNLPELDDF